MQKTKQTIKIVELNNKSRKGQYVYFRKGKKSYYYRIKPGYTVDQVLKFRNKTRNKHKPLPKTKKTQAKKIKTLIKAGISTTKINNPNTITNTQINRAKLNLLKPLIKKEKDLKVMTQDTNFNKLRQRLEYKLTLIDANGTPLGEASKMNVTLNTAIKDIRNSVSQGEETAMFETSPTIKKLKEKGWNVKTLADGRIAGTRLRIIFRKSK